MRQQPKHIHLSGICGTAMASLAGLLQLEGHRITGSDKAAYPPMSDLLRGLGIPVMEPYAEANLEPRPDLVSMLAHADATQDTDGRFVNSCSDAVNRPTPDRVRELVVAWGKLYPQFGPVAALNLVRCLHWPANQPPQPPKLTKEEYFTDPPLQRLLTLSSAELANVKAFSIGRTRGGRIDFCEPVDLRGADLDAERMLAREPLPHPLGRAIERAHDPDVMAERRQLLDARGHPLCRLRELP